MNKVIKTEEGLKNEIYICRKCGSNDIKFNTKLGKLYCSYCNSIFDGQKLNIITELEKLNGTIIGSGAKNIKNIDNIVTLKCNNCGAEVVIDTNESTEKRCHWCRGIMSLNTRIENGAVPDAILPFKVTKEEAITEIKKFVNNRKNFAKRKFKKEFLPSNVLGVYMPYVLVDVNASCDFDGVAERLVSQCSEKGMARYDSDLYRVKRKFDITVSDLTIETSNDENNIITDNIINSIMPFDTENCEQFMSIYLHGFTSEKRNIDISSIEKKIDIQVRDIIRQSLNKDMSFYDRGINWKNQLVKINGVQIITAYLPVWLYSYFDKHNNKVHYVAVNGRTKETMGSVPGSSESLSI